MATISAYKSTVSNVERLRALLEEYGTAEVSRSQALDYAVMVGLASALQRIHRDGKPPIHFASLRDTVARLDAATASPPPEAPPVQDAAAPA